MSKRIWEHKTKAVKGFTEKYGLDKLVWYETHLSMDAAIQREKIIKKWKRERKLKIIEDINPEWRDLYEEIV